jgi:hypothetical protein
MNIDEAKEILKKCNSGELYFTTPKRYETIAECICIILTELDSKDKEIQRLERLISKMTSGIVIENLAKEEK